MNVRGKLSEIARIEAAEHYRVEFLQSANSQAIEEAGLGIALSKWADLDRDTILAVCATALEEGNHHLEARAIRAMFSRLKINFQTTRT